MPRHNVQVNRPVMRVDTRPAQMNLDSYSARSSTGPAGMNTFDFMRDEVSRAWQTAREGTVRIVEDGNALARGSSPVEIAVQHNRANFNIETITDFIPRQGVTFSPTPGEINVDIQPNEVSIDWEHLFAERAIYHAGSIDVQVVQYPEVVIEFVGPILYFPPSANPDYTPSVSIVV
jgi:hypothetical protein